MPATVRSILGNVCRKLSKDVRRELLLRRLEERDEHMRADHENLSDSLKPSSKA